MDVEDFYRVKAIDSHQEFVWAKILSSLGAIAALSCVNATPAWAETNSLYFTLSSDGHQTFETLVQQAESKAQQLIKQGFAQKASVTEVSVTILGERNGQQVPLLFSKVSRSNWQTKPKIEPWTKHFRNSAVLLGFLKPQGSQANSSSEREVAFNSDQPELEDDPYSRDE